MKWDLDDLASSGDIAVECGVSEASVSNWIKRYPDFPQPLATVSRGYTSLYSLKAVLDWYDRREWAHDGPLSRRAPA